MIRLFQENNDRLLSNKVPKMGQMCKCSRVRTLDLVVRPRVMFYCFKWNLGHLIRISILNCLVNELTGIN